MAVGQLTPGQVGIACNYHYWRGDRGVQFPTEYNPKFRAFSYEAAKTFFHDVVSFEDAEELIHPLIWG